MWCPRLTILALLVGLNSTSALEAEDIPYLVQYRSQKKGSKGYAVCTGSLITPSWVLTAKHCVVGLLYNRSVTVTVRFFDPAKIDVDTDVYPVKPKGMKFNARTVKVVEAHAPPQKGNDIALVKLGKAVTDVPVAVIDAVQYNQKRNTTVTPVGASEGLHWASPREAKGTKKLDRIYVDQTNGSGGMIGGDSGGPWLRKLDSKTYVVAGVISGGVRRGKKRYGKSYQPSFLRSWIDDLTDNVAKWSDDDLETTSEFEEVGVLTIPRSSTAAPLVAAVGLAVVGISMGVAAVRRGRVSVLKEEETPILEC